MSTPSIPPRPARSQKQDAPATAAMNIPVVPPRPNRLREKSTSPDRDRFARSPLNQTSFIAGTQAESLYSHDGSKSSSSLPPRPPSVTLPSIGQEGNEYANLGEPASDAEAMPPPESSPTKTRNVADDLQLHAPKPSLPTASAKARVANVTRTDSSQAAAAGFGKATSDDKDPQARPLKAKSSFASQASAASTERPGSAQYSDRDQNTPDVGQRVPMYPNAGDVQAPSPAPYPQTFPSGIGFHNDGSLRPGRHHGRTKSGRENFQPPGSYGLHGHGVPSQDRFEKAWYEKHPEALEREENGEYGPGIGGGRGEWALSSDDLNKIVRETANRGAGFGTSPTVMGTPNEQIGYLASEEYAARMASAAKSTPSSPRPMSSSYLNKGQPNTSLTHAESPLRNASFPAELQEKGDLSRVSTSGLSVSTSESEVDDDDVIHVKAPSHRIDKYGGGGYDPPVEDLGPQGGNTTEEGGWVDENGYGVPILASDEVAKEPGTEYMQPAVDPHKERRGSSFMTGSDSETPSYLRSGSRSGSISSSRPTSRPTSRPSSRPSSIHGLPGGLSRFTSHDDREDVHTPLENVEEYEPLFPEDEKENAKREQQRPLTAADKLKRPELAKRKFPSQDIWEDAPNSAQLMTIVSTPEPEEDAVTVTSLEDDRDTKVAAESREMDAADEDSESFLPKDQHATAKLKFKSHINDEMKSRPGMKQRFPSRDIWEDSPASAQLETFVDPPPPEEAVSAANAGESATTTSSERTSKVGGKEVVVGGIAAGLAAAGITAAVEQSGKPSVPARPVKKMSGDSKGIAATQPEIPARPLQRVHNVPPMWTPPSKDDNGSVEPTSSPVAEKKTAPGLPGRPKPQVPARPAKFGSRDSSEQIPLSQTTSGASADSLGSHSDDADTPRDGATAQTVKAKPAVPARPVGGKIASLKTGFMSTLEKRLQLGPQGPKAAETIDEPKGEEEKAPLSDARKGRARGPARRKPVASPSALGERSDSEGPKKLEIAPASSVWEVSENGSVVVHESMFGTLPKTFAHETKAEKDNTPTLATNTAGEGLHAPHEIAEGASTASHDPAPVDDQLQAKKETEQKVGLAEITDKDAAKTTLPKSSDDPKVSGLPHPSSVAAGASQVKGEDPDVSTIKEANLVEPEVPSKRAEVAAQEMDDESTPSAHHTSADTEVS